MSEVISDFTNKRAVFFIFEKSKRCLQVFKKPEEENLLTQMAAEIIAASQNKDISGKDYWAYGSWDPDLRQILVWHELSNIRYYSIVLTPDSSVFWRDAVRPFIDGKKPLFERSILEDISKNFNNHLKNIRKESLLLFVDININEHVNKFIQQLVKDCHLNLQDLYKNAFRLTVFQPAKSKTR